MDSRPLAAGLAQGRDAGSRSVAVGASLAPARLSDDEVLREIGNSPAQEYCHELSDPPGYTVFGGQRPVHVGYDVIVVRGRRDI